MLNEVVEIGAALCGFRNCRAPLPPPGPRGGRPYEFCPDRRWPGDKSCKQLAAADLALRDALGESMPHVALTETTAEFVDAAAGLEEPLHALQAALETVRSGLRDEVSAAVRRTEEAEVRAAEADGLRRAAETRAGEAVATADAAEDEAREHLAAREAAEAVAGEAIAARKAAELAQARAEAAASAANDRAAAVEREARTERARADDLTNALAERTEQLAVRTAEHEALREALVSLRGSSADTETELRAQLASATTAHATDRARLHDLEEQLRRTLQEHRDRVNEAARELAETREQSATLAVSLAESRHQAAAHATERDALQARLSRVHQLVLEPVDDDTPLRPRLLAELLDLG